MLYSIGRGRNLFMLMKDIIKKFKRSPSHEVYIDFEDIAEDIGMSLDFDYHELNILGSRFKSYWWQRWRCTDTIVGIKLYYLDDVFVLMSLKTSRSSPTTFKWSNKESRDKIKSELLKCLKEPADNEFETIDFNEDWEVKHTLEHASQVVEEFGWYNGIKCEIIDCPFMTDDGKYNHSNVVIKRLGSIMTVDVRDIEFECLGMT